MKNQLLILVILIITTSCFPVKIAPNIESYKITTAKKFKRKLPKETSFIFNDPKDGGEFYNYINAKYSLNHVNVGANTHFKIDDKTYYLSYRETERETKTVNLALAAIDAKRESNGNSRLFEDNYSKRVGKWYILLTVYDEGLKNSLKPEHPSNKKVINYLEALRKEYLRTQNYLELQFVKKS